MEIWKLVNARFPDLMKKNHLRIRLREMYDEQTAKEVANVPEIQGKLDACMKGVGRFCSRIGSFFCHAGTGNIEDVINKKKQELKIRTRVRPKESAGSDAAGGQLEHLNRLADQVSASQSKTVGPLQHYHSMTPTTERNDRTGIDLKHDAKSQEDSHGIAFDHQKAVEHQPPPIFNRVVNCSAGYKVLHEESPSVSAGPAKSRTTFLLVLRSPRAKPAIDLGNQKWNAVVQSSLFLQKTKQEKIRAKTV